MDKYYTDIVVYDELINSTTNVCFEYDNSKLLKSSFGNRSMSRHENFKNLLENKELASKKKVNELVNIYISVQRMYYGFSRLAHIWKYRRAKIYNHEDLYLNPVSETDPNVMVILQNGRKYLFPLNELIKSSNENLMNSPYFFPTPLSCKNPYINSPLSKSHLYNLYYKIKDSNYLMPILFYRYYLCDFNIRIFSMRNTPLIRETYLKHYVDNINKQEVLDIVNEMLRYHRILNKLRIHPSIPKDILFEKMKKYIYMYYDSIYNTNVGMRLELCNTLSRKLRHIVEHNPNFGRKRIHFEVDKNNPFGKKIRTTQYNMEIPRFTEKNVVGFMNNHDEKYIDCEDIEIISSTHHDTNDRINMFERRRQSDAVNNIFQLTSREDSPQDVNTVSDEMSEASSETMSIENEDDDEMDGIDEMMDGVSL